MRPAMREFEKTYNGAVDAVLETLEPGFTTGLARHNPAWEGFDFERYLRSSLGRYERGLALARRELSEGASVLDVGGFLGAFPIALARLGHEVAISERYSYYGGAMDRTRELLGAEGVTVYDLDMTREQPPGRFDVVFAMAIAEHLPEPATLARNIGAATRAAAVIEVPSSVYWPKRVRALRGRGFGPAIAELWGADDPFTGHHREYTKRDLRELCRIGGLAPRRVISFNYTPITGRRALATRLPRALPGMREVLMARATPAAP